MRSFVPTSCCIVDKCCLCYLGHQSWERLKVSLIWPKRFRRFIRPLTSKIYFGTKLQRYLSGCTFSPQDIKVLFFCELLCLDNPVFLFGLNWGSKKWRDVFTRRYSDCTLGTTIPTCAMGDISVKGSETRLGQYSFFIMFFNFFFFYCKPNNPAGFLGRFYRPVPR